MDTKDKIFGIAFKGALKALALLAILILVIMAVSFFTR